MAEETWSLVADGLVIRRALARATHILRVRGADEAQLEALEGALRAPLPRGPNRAIGNAPRVLALAPGDWMVIGGAFVAEELSGAVRPALLHVSDLTQGRVTFELSGPRVRELLSKGTTLDLHPRALPPDGCAQTRLAQIHVLIDRPASAGGGAFVLYADVSYAAHLQAWFQAAAADFR